MILESEDMSKTIWRINISKIQNIKHSCVLKTSTGWAELCQARLHFATWVHTTSCMGHCKLLQLKNKLQGKAVTHSEKLEWWIILLVDCVTILLYTTVKWLHNPPLKYTTIQFFQIV